MSENAMYIGIGRANEKLSGGGKLKEKIRKAFTFKGAEQAYREKHAKEIQELITIHSSLPDEDREAAAAKLDQDISKKVHTTVYKNYAIATAVTLAAVGETLLIAKPTWAKGVENFQVKILGKPRKIFKPIGAQARIVRGGIDALINKAKMLRKQETPTETASPKADSIESKKDPFVSDENAKKVGKAQVKIEKPAEETRASSRGATNEPATAKNQKMGIISFEEMRKLQREAEDAYNKAEGITPPFFGKDVTSQSTPMADPNKIGDAEEIRRTAESQSANMQAEA